MPGPTPDARTLWGPLATRYVRQDDGARPHRMLALDGGGIRGALTLEILAEIERQLAELTGRKESFRLCDFFDYVGGTSTGAIIAAGIACGMSVKELLDFYVSIGPDMFQKDRLLARLKHLYTSDPLKAQLKKTFGDRTLDPKDLKCLLLIVTRNVTTDSPWPVSSAPTAKYNAPDRSNCNLKIPLWQLVRASTAAPIYFPPEILQWEPDKPDQSFVFVDGGMTPYNNPAFLLYRMATTPEYRLGWRSGEKQLMVISVGTGSAASLGADLLSPESNIASTLGGLPGALMGGASVDQDTNCRIIGRCVHGAPIDREIGDLIPRGPDGRSVDDPNAGPTPLATDLGRAFLYARYNADLTDKGLAALDLAGIDAESVRKLDAIEHIDDLRKIGKAVGKKHVRLAEQFGELVTANV
jgi:patatin-like phospholipase